MDLRVNGTSHAIPAAWQGESLLHLLREHLGLRGAKFGCGAGQCGACSVLVDGAAVRSCITPAADTVGSEIRTIEGLAAPAALHPLQQAWIDMAVPQCGYCQAGQIVAAAALLRRTPNPSDAEIDAAMSGNLCRCGTYRRIRAAIRQVAEATR
ncbi:MAG: (2Fe-2S)-binding protein [Sneathiellaceae bacterium]